MKLEEIRENIWYNMYFYWYIFDFSKLIIEIDVFNIIFLFIVGGFYICI